jgi:hypothetical protein
MRRPSCAMLAVISLLVAPAGCKNADGPPRAGAAQPAAAPFTTRLDLRQLMNWVMDPNAKVVFAAVATIVTEQGEQKVEPKTDAEWSNVRNSAAVILESGNLLMIAERTRDQGEWLERARELSTAAQAALEATEVKDPEALFTAAGAVYEACSGCHAQYVFTDATSTTQR